MKQLLLLFGLFFIGQVLSIAMDNPLEALGILAVSLLIAYTAKSLVRGKI